MTSAVLSCQAQSQHFSVFVFKLYCQLCCLLLLLPGLLMWMCTLQLQTLSAFTFSTFHPSLSDFTSHRIFTHLHCSYRRLVSFPSTLNSSITTSSLQLSCFLFWIQHLSSLLPAFPLERWPTSFWQASTVAFSFQGFTENSIQPNYFIVTMFFLLLLCHPILLIGSELWSCTTSHFQSSTFLPVFMYVNGEQPWLSTLL